MRVTPECADWNRRMAAQWTARAAVLREQPDRGSQTIAGALERISASLLAEVPAAVDVVHLPAVDAPAQAPDVDQWRARLAACQPYRCPRSGVMFNQGGIMDRLRERLQARIDGCPVSSHGSQHILTAPTARPAARPTEFAPPPEVVPFTMGPQTDMFGLLG